MHREMRWVCASRNVLSLCIKKRAGFVHQETCWICAGIEQEQSEHSRDLSGVSQSVCFWFKLSEQRFVPELTFIFVSSDFHSAECLYVILLQRHQPVLQWNCPMLKVKEPLRASTWRLQNDQNRAGEEQYGSSRLNSQST